MSSDSPPRQTRAIAAFALVPIVAGALAIFVGITVLVGWARDIDGLKTIVPGLIPTIPNTAVAFIVSGVALLCTIRSEVNARARQAAHVLAWTLVLTGFLFFFERATGIGFGIDLLLFGDKLVAAPWEPPGRPAINTTFVMMLNGAALLLIDTRTQRGHRPAEPLSTLAAAISFVAIVGYVYNVQGLYSFGQFTGMALLTAMTMLTVSLGILFVRPDRGAVSLIVGTDASGVMVRRLLPAGLIVPIGLGGLWLLMRRTGLLAGEAGVSVFVVAIVATFILLVMRAASVVRVADAEREDLLVTAQAARAEAERSADRTGRLQRTAEALSSALTPSEVARVIVGEGVQALRASASEVGVLSANGNVIDLMGVVGIPEDVADAWRRFPVNGAVPMATAVAESAPVILESPDVIASLYPDYAPVLERMNVNAVLAMPMVVDGRPVGAISFSFADPRAFGEGDLTFARALAQQCAQALERARLYAGEQSARAEAEAASRAKTDFLAMMSHELRTPLNAIAGYAELMELGISGPVTDMQREQLARIRRSQRHLLGIIEDLLDLSRLEHGAPTELDLGPVSMHETLGGLETLIAPQLRARNLTYIYNSCDPALTGHANRSRVEQIVLNLLSNAIKYTAPGGRIGLSCDLRAGVIDIRVSDTGHGIPPDKLESIFEPFTRVEMDLTRTTEGTGLGLAISRQLARAMQGDLTARSELGRGSIFILTLPVHVPPPAKAGAGAGVPAGRSAIVHEPVPLHRVRL